ncbi:MAG: hypothetical protein U0984_08915 [Prosthecobacter sp.]|nr:hypothetical protein [Prosthecobacter sp.]
MNRHSHPSSSVIRPYPRHLSNQSLDLINAAQLACETEYEGDVADAQAMNAESESSAGDNVTPPVSGRSPSRPHGDKCPHTHFLDP